MHGFSDTAGLADISRKTMPAMLPSTDLKASAPRTIAFSVLNSPAHPYRCRRFACPLAGANARLAEKRGLVIAGDLHPLTFCQFAWRPDLGGPTPPPNRCQDQNFARRVASNS